MHKQNIIILGNNLEAWLSANVLSKVLNTESYAITVVGAEQSQDSSIEYADTTLAEPKSLHSALAINENALVAKSNASFSFGIAVSGFSQNEQTYFHPFSSIGAKLGTVAFQHLVQRLRNEKQALRMGNFALATLAAQSYRFQRPSPDDRSVLSTCGWGMHINSADLMRLKKSTALAHGVKHIASDVESCKLNTDGSIAYVNTKNKNSIPGELFINCTKQSLNGFNVKSSWVDWSPYFKCNQRLSAVVNHSANTPTYSHAQAHSAGWLRHIPLQGQMFFSSIYSSEYMDENTALAELRKTAGNASLENIISEPVKFGRAQQFWNKNLINIGSTAISIDPLATSPLHLLRSNLNRLIGLLPSDLNSPATATEYNRLSALEMDNARDFAVLHYKLNGRSDDTFWDSCKNIKLPEVLNYKLDLYKARGHIAMYDEEPLEKHSWINLFDEHAIRPRSYNPLCNGYDLAFVQKHLQQIRNVMLSALKKIPLHDDYLLKIKQTFKTSNS